MIHFLQKNSCAFRLFFEGLNAVADTFFQNIITQNHGKFVPIHEVRREAQSVGDAAFPFLVGIFQMAQAELFSISDQAEKISRVIREAGVAVDEIGTVETGSGAYLRVDGQLSDFSPRFREAAYTPIKKAVGQDATRDIEEMRARVDLAARNAVEKKRRFIDKIKKS